MVVTSYVRNKNLEDEIKKNQEKANNSTSYRCAAINKYNSPPLNSRCIKSPPVKEKEWKLNKTVRNFNNFKNKRQKSRIINNTLLINNTFLSTKNPHEAQKRPF